LSLTVLNVAFPFAPINMDPVGGAEQVLAHIDRALAIAGHRSIVIAPAGSQTAGCLVAIPRTAGIVSDAVRRATHAAVREALARVLQRDRVDVVHLHGIDFHSYLPSAGPPILVTLHLPLEWYPPAALQTLVPGIWLQPVSTSQASKAARNVKLLPPVENGVQADAYPQVRKRSFALVLGRVCPEKGFHHALNAAKLAGVPLLIAGAVFPWPEHQSYFERQIAPGLDHQRRWLGPVRGYRKRWLLAAARCLLVPSLACETSSLVAMEALAAGTPVIAYDIGALPDIVDHGTTGYIVKNSAEMAGAIGRVERIQPEHCRRAARERFPLERCMAGYLGLYERLSGAVDSMRCSDLVSERQPSHSGRRVFSGTPTDSGIGASDDVWQ
jgi:glycosyltransferase involved in cell wall biosynthesis